MTKVLDQAEGEGWQAYNADAIDVLAALPAESIHYSIYSPPFASLYVYSASARDMGNCKDSREFLEHFSFLMPELLRVTKPGRLMSMHCMLLPTSKTRDGFIGLSDFRGDLIRAATDAGWIFHSEVSIWKDPVTAMQRTKALGLLHKQIRKDSTMSRQGIPDYLVTMRKPGVNTEPVEHTAETFPVERWQRYASPVWASAGGAPDDEGFLRLVQPSASNPDKCGIDQSDTLQGRSAREESDEKHICPLQLEVIRRGIRLWTNPGDIVLSPFAGIGSEGYVALQERRRFVGAELKPSYFRQLVKNIHGSTRQRSLNFGAEGQP
jgi:hypothetical protein